MPARDELTPALGRIWHPRLVQRGYQRVGRRDLLSLSSGVVRLFNFQLSGWGGRFFCINVAAFLLAGNTYTVLQPGFRLSSGRTELWLPSESTDEAVTSAEAAWAAAERQALPWLDRNETVEGHLQVLRLQRWASCHHQHFQIGVAEALLERPQSAASELREGIRLYIADGRGWCAAYVARAEVLLGALDKGTAASVLERWSRENMAAHRIR
jgi:hypothetical protein